KLPIGEAELRQRRLIGHERRGPLLYAASAVHYPRNNNHAKRVLMPDLSAFPITNRWPAKHPDRLQLYSLPTPNGVKVSIMLEEIGLPSEVPLVAFQKDDPHTPDSLYLHHT